MGALEAVFFDLDGTLYSFNPEQDRAYQSALEQFLYEKLGQPEGGARAVIDQIHSRHGKVSAFIKEHGWYEEYLQFVYGEQIAPEKFHRRDEQLVQVMQYIKSLGAKIGVVSTSPNQTGVRFASRTLKVLGVSDLVDAVSGSEAQYAKPDKRAYESMGQVLGAALCNAWAVGDDPWSDLKPAKDAGATTVFVQDNGKERKAAALISLPFVDHSIISVRTGLVPLLKEVLSHA